MTPDPAIVTVYKQLDYMAEALTKVEQQMAEQIDPRSFGQLEGAVKALADRVSELTDDMEGMRRDLRALTGVLSEAKGGWRTLAWLAGAAAAAGSVVTWIVTHIKFQP